MAAREYEEFYRRSLEDPEGFWGAEAERVYWHKPPERALDSSRPPFAHWFPGGETNLCYNAVDRHLEERGGQDAIVYVSTETGERRSYTYRQLHDEVNRLAAMLKELGVERGDRVIIYLPMTAEALFAMLACVRVGAIHSVVFGGFAAENLATRIDDARPKLLITTDAGMRGGEVIPYKPL
ncbi:MAG: AMP-binding protein, partial [Rubrobacter sp.]|nr:AMP-binding protein [Rubrobacter sp.]